VFFRKAPFGSPKTKPPRGLNFAGKEKSRFWLFSILPKYLVSLGIVGKTFFLPTLNLNVGPVLPFGKKFGKIGRDF